MIHEELAAALLELAEIRADRVQHVGELVVHGVDVVVEVEIREVDRARGVAEVRAEDPVEQAVEGRLGKLLREREPERQHIVGLVTARGAGIDDLADSPGRWCPHSNSGSS